MNQEVVDKIKKLLALSGSSNENEANTAFLKAQELLAKHKLSMQDVNTEEEKATVERTFIPVGSTSNWKIILAMVIADNFCCHGLIERYGKQGRMISFLGKEDDLLICTTAYKAAVKYVQDRVALMKKEKLFPDNKNLMNSYGTGFCAGLQLQYREHLAQHQEYALVLVKPKIVDDALDKMKENGVKAHGTKVKSDNLNHTAAMIGRVDGYEFQSEPTKVLPEVI